MNLIKRNRVTSLVSKVSNRIQDHSGEINKYFKIRKYFLLRDLEFLSKT